MDKLKREFNKWMRRGFDLVMGNGLMQEENEAAAGEKYHARGSGALIRQAAADSCVLLKNDGALPLDPRRQVAVFGRCQLDWFYVGYGSGGDVKAPYYVNLMDGLGMAGGRVDEELARLYRDWTALPENAADHGWWGHWPMNYPEMPVTGSLAARAAANADTALVVIGRAAGEDRENKLEKGSFYLTDAERSMLDQVTAAFQKTVVILNIGNIIDFSWVEDYGEKISALLIAWQGGMESGCGLADVLYGDVSPSGRLSDSIARHYEDYPGSADFGGLEYNEYSEGVFVGYRYFERYAPEKVLYPFGFGLSYARFETKALRFSVKNGAVEAAVTVRNTGARPGREVVQLWCTLPEGRLEKPVRVLVAFGKTGELRPGQSEELTLRCEEKAYASYDESRHAFLLEAGGYGFAANDCVLGILSLEEERLVEQCQAACVPSVDLRQRILDRLPAAIPATGFLGWRLRDVAEGRVSLDAFIAQLSDAELEALSRGKGMMNVPEGVPGNAGAFGGVIRSLRDKGVPPLITSDGPAGLRLKKTASLCPCGTALACTWDQELVERLYRKIGEEMAHYGVDVYLGPGMNIHRNPLCGRNFEYFSEDPTLSGKMAAAVVRGVQSSGRASCPKHFACNNQETKRNTNDSRVSERALREIYLRNFEICVKESAPKTIMTSYNKINGVWSHYNYDLVTTVLRKEWGFDGVVITDWWMQRSASPEFPALRDNAYRVRAQVDVLMPGNMGHTARKYRSDGTLLKTLDQPGGITRAELQRTARTVLRLCLEKLRRQL